MKTAILSRVSRVTLRTLIASLSVLILSVCSLASLSAQDVCSADTSFTDILFVIDNSGSIDDQEYDEFSDIIMATIRNVQAKCQSSQIGVLHYGGAFGTESFLEYDFSRFNTIPDVERQYCTTRNQFGNCSEGGGDDLNAAMGSVVEGIQNGTLNRRQINKLAIVIFTDAFGFDETCNFINCSVIRPYTNIDILKSQYDANVTVIGASSQAEATLLGLYASPGGSFDRVRLFPQDCESTFDGCQLPRKYVPIEFDSPVGPTSDSIAVCVDCTIEIIGGVVAVASDDQTICEEEDGTVTLTANLLNATQPVTYAWDQGIGTGNSVQVSPLSTTTYTVTATDANGCSSTDEVTITVDNCIPDCVAPIINCPPDYQSCPEGTTDPSTTGMATASNPNGNNEFCGSIIITYSDEMVNMGDCTNQIIRRTFTATDSLNTSLSATCVQTITLTDVVPPVILSCPEDVTLDPDNPVHVWRDPTVQENCSFTLTYNIPSGSTFAPGATTVIVTATDQCGNFDTCSFIVTVPAEVMIVCPADITLGCVEMLSSTDLPVAQATSNCPLCQSNPNNCTTVQSSITDTIVDGDLILYEVTHLATDLCDNSISCTSRIIIDQVVADAGEDQTICEEDNATITLTANLSNASQPITYEWDQGLGTGNNIQVTPLTTTTYSVTATDVNGCSSTDEITITVDNCIPDCVAPIITCPPDYQSCPGGSTDPSMTGMATTSNPNGNNEFCGNIIVTFSDEMVNMGDCANQMIIRRTFTARDSLNPSLVTTCVQVISLTDTIAPMIITCPGDVILDPDNPIHEWQDPTVEENCSFTITYNIPNGSSFAIGSTTVIATATDQCGNFDTCSFVVTVPEDVMIICPEDVIIRCDESMSIADIPDAEVNSNCPLCIDNPANCTEVQSSITDTIIDGERTIYEITYIATDLCNTSSSCTSRIIIDNSAYIECPADIVVEAPPFGFTDVSWEKPVFQTCCTLCKVRQIPGFLYMGQLEDSYYYCSYARVNWAKAQRTAEANEGHLVAINSALENEFIASRLIERNAYIGLTDSGTEGSFEWVNGDPLGYENWKTGQPDNDNNEDVVEMNAQGYWYDVDGKVKREFVMEIEGCQHVTQIGGPSPGSKFRLGRTPITYVAEDGCGNTDTCTFDVILTPFLPDETAALISEARSSLDIEINPNPASSNLYISNSTGDQILSIDVYQVNGQLIDQKVNINRSEVNMDVSGYQSGLHLIRFTTQSGEVLIRKVIID